MNHPTWVRTSRRAHGYSVIELILVMVIVVILAVAGISTLGAKSPRAVRTTLIGVKAALAECRQLSISSGKALALSMPYDGKMDCKITAVTADTLAQEVFSTALERSSLKLVTVSAKVDDLPNKSVQELEASKSFGFESGAAGWDVSLANTDKKYGFSPSGVPVSVSGVDVSPLPGGFWIGVVGTSPNEKGVPYGVLLVTERGQIIAFYKGDSESDEKPEHKWQRLE